MSLRFDPASYPGARPAGPVVVHRGEVVEVALDGPATAPLRPIQAARTTRTARTTETVRTARSASVIAVLDDQPAIRWSIAYGSNASPGRLVDKGLDARGAVLLPARIVGWTPAFEHRRTGYGAIPLTLVPTPGRVTATWVVGLHRDDVDHLDRTEGRLGDPAAARPARPARPARDDATLPPPGTYRLARVGEVVVADRFRLSDALAYLPGPATRVQVRGDGGWRCWPDDDQAAAREHVDEGGPHRRPPPVVEPVLGSWPRTPLVEPT